MVVIHAGISYNILYAARRKEEEEGEERGKKEEEGIHTHH